MAKKLFISDERMLKVIEWVVKQGKYDSENEFLKAIGFARESMPKLKAGGQGFTKYQILEACVITGASADYIYGFTNSMFRKDPTKPLDMLKHAVHAVEMELKGK